MLYVRDAQFRKCSMNCVSACAQGNSILIIIQFNPIVVVASCECCCMHSKNNWNFIFVLKEKIHMMHEYHENYYYLKYIIGMARSTHLYGGNCNITWSLLSSCYVALKCLHICNVVLLAYINDRECFHLSEENDVNGFSMGKRSAFFVCVCGG